ncbi:hypothetical protein R1sor_006490 [Riccia sorocarpa]|uniref:MSP domain-containing protein n=1 Tax=Riccia sorocarpa TaxID=122646 RepID=A0ABD3HU02_9MARC
MPGERELLSIQPGELKFPFELKKQISCSLRLVNTTDNYVAFKVKTTSPKKYCVRPNTGLVLPQSSSDVTVTMQAQKEAPPDMQCKDKFLVQSVIAPFGISVKEVNQELFNKDAGKEIHEAKLRVLYVAPPQPPSPVAESAEEGLSSPKSNLASDNGERHFLSAHDANSKDVNELKAKLTELRASLTTLTTERNSALELSQRLQQELTNMVATAEKRNAGKGSSQASKSQQAQGFSFLFVFIVGILGILVGYFMSP